jgi:hypothetical protein
MAIIQEPVVISDFLKNRPQFLALERVSALNEEQISHCNRPSLLTGVGNVTEIAVTDFAGVP